MPTAVEALEQRLLDGGWAYLEGMQGTPEDLHLEFKRKKNPRMPEWDRSDRQNLAEALSGFANSDGGIVVWGADARPGTDPDRIDSLQGLVPITNLNRFAADLRALSAEYVAPGLPDFRVHQVANPTGDGSGVALTVVPQSDAAPHMAIGPDMHTYHQRIVGRFIVMEHYAIADMMGRRPQPKLELSAQARMSIVRYEGAGQIGRLEVAVVIRNVGRGLMRFPCVSLGTPVGRELPNVIPGRLAAVQPPSNWLYRVVGTADTVVYPGDELPAVTITSDEMWGDLRGLPDFRIRCAAVAADCPAVEVEVFKSGTEIALEWRRLRGLGDA